MGRGRGGYPGFGYGGYFGAGYGYDAAYLTGYGGGWAYPGYGGYGGQGQGNMENKTGVCSVFCK